MAVVCIKQVATFYMYSVSKNHRHMFGTVVCGEVVAVSKRSPMQDLLHSISNQQ